MNLVEFVPPTPHPLGDTISEIIDKGGYF